MNELTIYGKLCWNATIFYRQELASLFEVYLDFSSSCFIADDSHLKTVWLNAVGFNEHDILHFWDNIHLFKYYPVKLPQNCFNSSIAQIKPAYKFLNLRLHWINKKVFVNCRNATLGAQMGYLWGTNGVQFTIYATVVLYKKTINFLRFSVYLGSAD